MKVTLAASALFLLAFVLPDAGATPTLASDATRAANRKPSAALRAAEARVRRLQAANLCHARRPSRCRKPSSSALSKAVKSLQNAAKRERKSLRLQKPIYRTFVIEPLVGRADATILMLSGFSGLASDRVEEVTRIMRKGILKKVRVVIPQAEPRFNTFFGTTHLPSWFDLPANQAGPWRTDEIFAAASNVASLLDVSSTIFGLDRLRTGVQGESQGAALALTVSLRHSVSAVTSLVGFLPAPEAWPASMTRESLKAPVLFISAGADELVPKEGSQLSVQLLRSMGRMVKADRLKGQPHSLGTARKRTLERGMRFVHKNIGILPGAEESKNGDLGVDPVVWELL